MPIGRIHLAFTIILLLAFVSIPLSKAQLVTSHVVINEFEQNPPGDERYTGGEFVELFNPTGSPVDIGGWSLSTTHGNICSYTMPSGTTIAKGPSWYVVSFTGQCIDNNDPDSVVLRNKSGAEIDRTQVKTDTFNDNRDWQRVPDAGTGWEFKITTKGYNNAPNPIPEFSSHVVVMLAVIFVPFVLMKKLRPVKR